MKLGVSLPDDLVTFADKEAERRGTSRSAYLAQLLEADKLRSQVAEYIDRHGWDVSESDDRWRAYQRIRMKEDYADDDW